LQYHVQNTLSALPSWYWWICRSEAVLDVTDVSPLCNAKVKTARSSVFILFVAFTFCHLLEFPVYFSSVQLQQRCWNFRCLGNQVTNEAGCIVIKTNCVSSSTRSLPLCLICANVQSFKWWSCGFLHCSVERFFFCFILEESAASFVRVTFSSNIILWRTSAMKTCKLIFEFYYFQQT